MFLVLENSLKGPYIVSTHHSTNLDLYINILYLFYIISSLCTFVYYIWSFLYVLPCNAVTISPRAKTYRDKPVLKLLFLKIQTTNKLKRALTSSYHNSQAHLNLTKLLAYTYSLYNKTVYKISPITSLLKINNKRKRKPYHDNNKFCLHVHTITLLW